MNFYMSTPNIIQFYLSVCAYSYLYFFSYLLQSMSINQNYSFIFLKARTKYGRFGSLQFFSRLSKKFYISLNRTNNFSFPLVLAFIIILFFYRISCYTPSYHLLIAFRNRLSQFDNCGCCTANNDITDVNLYNCIDVDSVILAVGILSIIFDTHSINLPSYSNTKKNSKTNATNGSYISHPISTKTKNVHQHDKKYAKQQISLKFAKKIEKSRRQSEDKQIKYKNIHNLFSLFCWIIFSTLSENDYCLLNNEGHAKQHQKVKANMWIRINTYMKIFKYGLKSDGRKSNGPNIRLLYLIINYVANFRFLFLIKICQVQIIFY